MVDTALFIDLMTYLPNDLLVKIDIASMAVSFEARSSFLDHRVIEFAASLPENFKVRGLTKKYLLKRALKTLVPLCGLSGSLIEHSLLRVSCREIPIKDQIIFTLTPIEPCK